MLRSAGALGRSGRLDYPRPGYVSPSSGHTRRRHATVFKLSMRVPSAGRLDEGLVHEPPGAIHGKPCGYGEY